MRRLAFLDANVLAKPFTRTLIVVGAAQEDADYTAGWSEYAEAEGNRHLRAQAKTLDVFRAERGLSLSPTGGGTDQYVATDTKDRQTRLGSPNVSTANQMALIRDDRRA